MTWLAAAMLGGLVGASILFALTAVATRLPAIKRRPALSAALWLVVLGRFVLPIPIGGGLSLESRIADAFATSTWLTGQASVAAPIVDAASARAFSLADGLALGWFVIAVGLLWLTVSAAFRTRRRLAQLPAAPAKTKRRAEVLAARIGLRRTPTIVVGAKAPLSFGVVRPIIAIPDWLKDDSLDHVLAHELAHIARRDPIWAALVRLSQVTLFFVPLVWIASRQFAAAREAACDRAAIAATNADSRAYARTLVEVSARLSLGRSLGRQPMALAMASAPSQLTTRVNDLLADGKSGVGVLGAVLVAAQLVLALPGSSHASDNVLSIRECVPPPGAAEQIISEFPDADRDGDGVLTRAEICAHQQRLRESSDHARQGELFVEVAAPLCEEDLRCVEGGEADLYE